jgi:serine/threonine-protein kinase HipA
MGKKMRKAKIMMRDVFAGTLEELPDGKFRFQYDENYKKEPISLTMPIIKSIYEFDQFPTYFEGLLPEGIMLEALLLKYKLDRKDYFGQLIQVGNDLVGAVTVHEV